MTLSAIKWKDIVCCKIFSVKRQCQFRQFLLRHCWLWDIFCFYQKRHCQLWDNFSFQTFAVFIKKTLSVMRYLQLSDFCSCPTLAVVRLLQLSNTCSCQTIAAILFLLHFISQESLRPWILNISGIFWSELLLQCVLQKSFVGRIKVIYPKYSTFFAAFYIERISSSLNLLRIFKNISRIFRSELQSKCVLQKSFVGSIKVIYPKYSKHDALYTIQWASYVVGVSLT